MSNLSSMLLKKKEPLLPVDTISQSAPKFPNRRFPKIFSGPKENIYSVGATLHISIVQKISQKSTKKYQTCQMCHYNLLMREIRLAHNLRRSIALLYAKSCKGKIPKCQMCQQKFFLAPLPFQFIFRNLREIRIFLEQICR